MCEWMPSLEEQDAAEKYVLERPISRPDTNIKKAVISVVMYIVFSSLFAAGSYVLLDRLGIFFYLSGPLLEWRAAHPAVFILLFVLAIFALTGVFALRPAVIGCVRLYQHYADEDVRRRCLFMPTCSEYAILAVKKYGVIIGLIMTANRLFRKCRGNIYRIDYP
ncbi:MAG: membrane protein insertion efficiency factor YidD [Oscillospiraceae bacterium]